MQAHVLDKGWYVNFIAIDVANTETHDNSADSGGAEIFTDEDDFVNQLEQYEAEGYEIILEPIDYYLRD
tara:strand:+ start:1453 stop:1659 length:207 start_codon:yes stop_codon:yes gene_type:complete